MASCRSVLSSEIRKLLQRIPSSDGFQNVFRLGEQSRPRDSFRGNVVRRSIKGFEDQKRYQLAIAAARPPALRQWHTLRAVVVADLIQAYFKGKLWLDRRSYLFMVGIGGAKQIVSAWAEEWDKATRLVMPRPSPYRTRITLS
jgi:hypothetical protein